MRKSPPVASFEPTGSQELLVEFEALVGEVIRLRTEGCTGMDIARAQGAADGFARALATAGIVTERELLTAAQRARRGGTASLTRPVESIDSAAELLSPRAITRVAV